MTKVTLPVSGERHIVDITGLTHGGEGVGRLHGIPVFVPQTVPGDQVELIITQVKKKFALGKLLVVKKPSCARRVPVCSQSGRCGGCDLQAMEYWEQLKWKAELVRSSLARIGRLQDVYVKETIGLENPWHYRNKATYQVLKDKDGITLGFYEKGTHILNRHEKEMGLSPPKPAACLLLDEDLNRVAAAVETVLNQYMDSAEFIPGHLDLLQQVIIRKAVVTGEIMVVLVTGSGRWPVEKTITANIKKRIPEMTGLLRSVLPKPQARRPEPEIKLLAGKNDLTDFIGNLVFRISAASFYQVNSRQTPVLYQKALEYAHLTGEETVVDAYSGIGTIALYLARQAGKVYGLEIVPAATADALVNAKMNNITNAVFQTGAVEKLLPELVAKGLRPDVLILDPPRRGCAPAALAAVVKARVKRVVYLSCDPGTLARDLHYLADCRYNILEVQPLDMFPWTAHVETVCLLSENNS